MPTFGYFPLNWSIVKELTTRGVESSGTKFKSEFYGHLYWDNFSPRVGFRDLPGDFGIVPHFG